MAKKSSGTKRRPGTARLRSSLIKLRSHLTPAGRKQLNRLVTSMDKDCTDAQLGNRFFKQAAARKRK